MKKILLTLRIAFVIITFLFTGCNKQFEVTTEYLPFKSDFEKSTVFYTLEQALALPEAQRPGRDAEHALVGLIFKNNGELYTANEFELIFAKLMNHEIVPTEYFTDLETFYKITHRKTASPEYALIIPQGTEGEIFVYDAFRKNYQTREKLDQIFYEKLKEDKNEPNFDFSGDTVMDRATNWAGYLQNARIIRGFWTGGNQYGHCCIVYNQATGSNYNTASALLSATTTFDAWGAVTPTSAQVGEKNGGTYWNSSNCYGRTKLWYSSGLTSSEISTIKTYSKQQDPDLYGLWPTVGLWSEDKWYCSKLVFRAYYQAGKDIKNGASYYVTPADIAADSDINGQCF